MMRLTSRLCISLIVSVAAVSLAIAYVQTRADAGNLERELESHAGTLAESMARSVEPLVENRSYRELVRLVDRFKSQKQIAGIAVYGAGGEPLALSSGIVSRLEQNPSLIKDALDEGLTRMQLMKLEGVPMHVVAWPLRVGPEVIGALALFHDASYMTQQTSALWRRALIGVATQTALITVITLIFVRRGVGRPLLRMAQRLREARTGQATGGAGDHHHDNDFRPLSQEVARIASSLAEARAAAQEEARLRESGESSWTPDRLRAFVQMRMGEDRLFAVSNREPYEHRHGANGTECIVPASGLVTALEPILRACNGTWIAQATGNADRETSDSEGRLRVPPDHPQYSLRRVWLTPEEEKGFYLGFANEGLWPLCHIAHTRPTFRAEDWEAYRSVNQKFADILLDEIRDEVRPVVLVQDYHFALLPQMIKKQRPDARVAIFWHIPWPNSEAFGICPWQQELLEGLLGADLIGFHIQAHCNNFLDTVDRALESRIDRARFAVTREGHQTQVRPYPISVSFEKPEEAEGASVETVYLQRAELLRQHGVRAPFMGVGVDRIDYTKGIPERLRGIERFLENCPAYRREFTFVQIGSPSRTSISRYHDLMQEVIDEAERINRRFQTSDWKPIIMLTRQHSHQEILPYYRAADLCLVTSLHDGMNLVAKEFVAARDDDQGVLVLSRFTGASHELGDALMVNPYDTEEIANALLRALEMSPEERRDRMMRMRATVRGHNIYRWAGSLLGELCDIRTAPPVHARSKSLRPVLLQRSARS